MRAARDGGLPALTRQALMFMCSVTPSPSLCLSRGQVFTGHMLSPQKCPTFLPTIPQGLTAHTDGAERFRLLLMHPFENNKQAALCPPKDMFKF